MNIDRYCLSAIDRRIDSKMKYVQFAYHFVNKSKVAKVNEVLLFGFISAKLIIISSL